MIFFFYINIVASLRFQLRCVRCYDSEWSSLPPSLNRRVLNHSSIIHPVALVKQLKLLSQTALLLFFCTRQRFESPNVKLNEHKQAQILDHLHFAVGLAAE